MRQPRHSDSTKAKFKLYATLGAVVATVLGSHAYMTSLPKPGVAGAEAEVVKHDRRTAERLESTVGWLCEDIGRRSSRFCVQEEALAAGIDMALEREGFELQSYDYKIGSSTYTNHIGVRRGRGKGAIFVGTHYDSYGKGVCANGAATGVAAVFEMMHKLRRETLDKTLYVGFFGTGEKPHKGEVTSGAHLWVEKSKEEGIVIDEAYLVGSFGCFRPGDLGQNSSFPWYLTYPGSSDWVAVYGNLSGRDLVKKTLNSWGTLTKLPARGFAAPSWMLGIPAVLFSDTGEQRDTTIRSRSDVPYIIDYEQMSTRVDAFTKVVLAATKGAGGTSTVATR